GEFIGFASPDGQVWTEVHRVTLTAPPDKMLAGLALSAADKKDTGVSAQLTFCSTTLGGEPPPPEGIFHRGDADDNGKLEITDATRILGFLFLGPAEPTCMETGDADDDGKIQLTDAIRVLGFLYLGAAAPAPPGPPSSSCGPDPPDSPGNLGCAK